MATEPPPSHIVGVTRRLREDGDGVVVLVDKNAPPPRKAEEQPPAAGADYAAQLRAATDYLDFVQALLPAASAGDHAAQFRVFRALDFCAIEYRANFIRRGVRRTLDVALSEAVTRWPFDPEYVRLVYARCHRLVESDEAGLRNRGEWLQRAADGGYPIAQATASHTRISESLFTHSDEVAASETGQRLMSMAIRSGDPEVIWEIGNFGIAPVWDDDVTNPDLAWFLAACQRGFDCSPRSDPVRELCFTNRDCQPYESVEDVLRRGTGNDYPVLEARARWINEKIDASDWAALGF